jgi:NADPH2:quinone reductase
VQALELQRLDGPDGLRLVERRDPDAGDHVVIDVRAAGVCFPDLLISQGRYQLKATLPYVPGLEVAGLVRSAPPGAGLTPGDRVWAFLDGGGFASVVACPADRVFPLPEGLSFEQGAALGVNFLTAVFALGPRAHLQRGEDVLVLGAAGGLGTATITVAKAMGARVLAVVSTAEKAPTAREAGADEVIVGPDWRDQALALTDGAGAGVVADIVGGDATLQAVRTTRPGGRVLVLGFTSGDIGAVPSNRLLLRNVSLVGAGLGAFAESDPGIYATAAAEVLRLLADGPGPVVGTVLPLAEGAEALRLLQRREARGKLVLSVG